MVVKKKQSKKTLPKKTKNKKTVKEPVKKEIKIGISLAPQPLSFTFEGSIEIFRFMTQLPELAVFLRSRRLDDVTSFDGCCAIGMFFIHLNRLLNEFQNRELFYWMTKTIHPILLGYGVHSRTPNIVFTDECQRYCFFRFCCCLGIGFLKNPYKEENIEVTLDNETTAIIKEYCCFASNK